MLLPKKKWDLRDIANWRPFALCADYKVLSKTLANKLNNAMHYVMHSDQFYVSMLTKYAHSDWLKFIEIHRDLFIEIL